MTGDPLDRIAENAEELERNASRFATDEPFLAVVLDDGAANLRALREVARAARALIADREGATIGEERLALRAALARLDGMEPGTNSGGDPVVVHPADSLAESQSELNGPSGSPTSPPGRESRRNRVSDLPDGLHGYTPEEAFEVRVKHATAKLCDFDPDAAAYYQRTEAWVRLVLAADDQREAEWNPQYEARQ